MKLLRFASSIYCFAVFFLNLSNGKTIDVTLSRIRRGIERHRSQSGNGHIHGHISSGRQGLGVLSNHFGGNGLPRAEHYPSNGVHSSGNGNGIHNLGHRGSYRFPILPNRDVSKSHPHPHPPVNLHQTPRQSNHGYSSGIGQPHHANVHRGHQGYGGGYGINHKVLRSEIGHGFGYGRSIGPAHHNNYGGYHNNKASLTAINAAALQAAHQINSLDRVASYSFAGNRDVGNYGLY